MLTQAEADILAAATNILKREGDYAETRDENSSGVTYVAGIANMVSNGLFDYLNCANHYAGDEEAERVMRGL